ncbi:MAG: hypothetical protein HY912_04080 [Desulfomonile tiedjei]|uniref:Uncharacterized protein n=1 Tax=Desulfomonile tiedjei TaxID=2358 RepID=A0A9D6V0X8_9BACT|nr:hypothetical protein [Desulfomonile tiedjei]
MSELGILCIVGSCISAILIIHLWVKRNGDMRWKLFWTIALLVIYIGPVFYWAFYDPPPKKSLSQQIKDANYRF